MLDLAREVLEVPLHGVIGGLHLPVHPWPRHLPQALTGSPRPPWRPLSDPDIDAAMSRLRAAGASLVAVSGHDSTPYTMGRFAAAFGAGFQGVRVGAEIRIQSPSEHDGPDGRAGTPCRRLGGSAPGSTCRGVDSMASFFGLAVWAGGHGRLSGRAAPRVLW